MGSDVTKVADAKERLAKNVDTTEVGWEGKKEEDQDEAMVS